MLFLRLIRESYLFAMNAIIVNKLRTLLSLLGITIGIFAIITVFTITDSMETTIRSGIESLGDNVLFVQKWPWSFGADYPWWKYMKRPVPKYREMEDLERRCNGAEAMAFTINLSKTVKYESRSISDVQILAVSEDYDKVRTVNVVDGRYITQDESAAGRAVAIIGATVAEDLFPGINPLDKEIKVFDRKLKVIGLMKAEGATSFGPSADNSVIIPVNYARNIMDIEYEGANPMIMVKAKKNFSNDELRAEVTGVLRSIHRLRPAEEEDFSINETSLLTQGFEGLFNGVSIAGWIIGGFSILVGGFGIANIMFVSVKERTSIIGIQKSLGAKNYFILFQFLFEAIILCLIGGIVGLLLIFLGTVLISSLFDMTITLTQGNIILGLSISAIIGLVSGFIPAWVAAKLNPVDAIRSNG
jgi:putative ABC transport system permease protein